jgi:hypothetical protein
MASPITEEEAIEFASALADSVHHDHSEQYFELLNWSRIFDTATSIPRLLELHDARSDFKARGMAAVMSPGGLHSEIHNTIQDGGGYTPLRVNVGDRELNVLFRLNHANGGLNYHRYCLMRDCRGAVVAGDMFNFLDAEDLSHSLRRVWFSIARLTMQEINTPYEAEPDDFLTHIDEFLEIDSLVDQEQYKTALDLYLNLPESLQKDKHLMALSLTAAREVSDADYSQIIELFHRTYPQDPALDLMLMDGYFLRKKYASALRCIERLNELIGGDDLLSAKRSACFCNSAGLMKRGEPPTQLFLESPRCAMGTPSDSMWHWPSGISTTR